MLAQCMATNVLDGKLYISVSQHDKQLQNITCSMIKIHLPWSGNNYYYIIRYEVKGVSGVYRPQGVSDVYHPHGVSGVYHPQGVSGVYHPQGVSGVYHPEDVSGVYHPLSLLTANIMLIQINDII